ncbi:hypothetical protein VTO42DRAFT_2397 [Malbranchea cinnamomea]
MVKAASSHQTDKSFESKRVTKKNPDATHLVRLELRVADELYYCEMVDQSNPDLLRVFVRLTGGTRILVPAPHNAIVQDIHQAALERAQRFGIQGTTENTVLETVGNDSPIALFAEDSLYDILDLTEDNTFSLRSIRPEEAALEAATSVLHAAPSDPSSSRLTHSLGTAHSGKDTIFVRWITLEDAVEYLQLRQIPVESTPFLPETTLAELYRTAVALLCGRSQRGACTNPERLNLYLKECHLNAENNLATLADLSLSGSQTAPLDIFVELVGPENRGTLEKLTPSVEPTDLWSFDSTGRGLCTLFTSLQILLDGIERKTYTIDSVLALLSELTHFPPVLLAFRHIYQSGLKASTSASHFLLVAAAFHAISKTMVPSFLCSHTDALLEASRQVTAWIASLHSSVREQPQLVKPVEIYKVVDDQPISSSMQHSFDHDVFETASNQKTKYSVKLDEDDQPLSRLLALAINSGCSAGWDFYFCKPDVAWNEFLDHWLTPTLHPNEFDHLIQTTNTRGAFRMVGPLQLGKCLAAELPVITLSPSGYVSRYDQEDYECAEKRFYLWNILEKKVDLPRMNPGQFISQKLEPVIAERKKEHAWELDAWAEWSEVTTFGPPDEAIVICVDVSDSMNLPMHSDWLPTQDHRGHKPSRITEVKEFFRNFALRISALNLSTHLGLVTFASSDWVNVRQQLTAVHLNFHQELENIVASGVTAIYDALSTAADMLQDVKRRHPKAKLRIVLLTDGEDNSSTVKPDVVATKLYTDEILLDAIVIGTTKRADLFKIAKITGGYAFAPETQQALFQIFLLETVVDIRTRPDPVRVALDKTPWHQFSPKKADMQNWYDIPPCRPHPNVDDYFIALKDADRFLSYLSRPPKPNFESVISDSIRSPLPTGMSGNTLASMNVSNARILLNEVKAAIEHPHDYIDVYVSERNMGFWKVVLQGPPESAYEDGVFLLYVEIGSEFPRKPPTARFITPVLHPNITKHGRVCHPIFDREWTPQTRVFQVLQHLYGILMSIEARDAVDPLSSLRFWTDPKQGRKEVKRYIDRFASRSRAQLRADIIGDDVSTITSGMTVTSSQNFTPTLPPVADANENWGADASARSHNPDESQSILSDPPSYRSDPPSVVAERLPPYSSPGQQRRPPRARRAAFFEKIKNLRS